MKKFIFLIVLVIIISGLIYNYYVSNPTKVQNSNIPFLKKQQTMILKSNVFLNQAKIPSKYTCDDEGINPPLSFYDVPPEARSLALIVEDPDAPSKNFTHWVVFDMDASVGEISENSLPIGAVEGENGIGEIGYLGPCPPTGTHRYVFTLYALDSMLRLDKGTSKEALLSKMDGHILAETVLTGLYEKN